MKKTLALILTFIMVLALVPTVALAEELNIQKVEIVDTIKNDGRLSLKVTGGADDDITNQLPGSGYTITWKRGEREVKRVKVTGNKYNMADNGEWVNVAYDQGAQKTYTVTISKDGTEITSVPMKVDWNVKLQNRSFEQPVITANDDSHVTVCRANDGTPAIQYIKQEKVPGWKTTVKTYTGETTSHDKAHWIEIGNVVKQYNNGNPYNCKEAKDGDQVAELNAIAPGALYQDVLTVPTATMKWQVSHKGRLGYDTMALVIAPLSKVEGLTEQTALRAYIDDKLNDAAEYNGDGVFIKTFQSDNTTWGTYTGSYIVPDGQFATRYFFVAMETNGGNLSCGNLLDDLGFETTTPLPDDDEGQLIIKKKIVGLSEKAANTLIANVFITYQVGTEAPKPAKLNNLTADQNGFFTATFTTGITVPANDKVTVTVTENKTGAAVDGYKLTVSGGNQQTVTIKKGEPQVVSFTNTYESTQPPLDTGTLTVTKTVTGNEGDKNKDFTFTVTLKRPEITVDALAAPIINATPGTFAAPTPVTETYDGVTFINGVATFTLKHNESKTIKGIPADMTYTVTESDNAGYTVTSENDKGTIEGGKTADVKFTNTKGSTPTPTPTPYNGGGYYHPTTTPVPVIVIPPKTGDMTVWQSILHFLGIR